MKTNIVNYFNDTDYSSVIDRVMNKASNLLNIGAQTVTVILIDNSKIHELNLQYRQKDYATDVLTFPDGYMHHLGDIFISVEKCTEQAKELEHSFDRELGFLTVHGLLHALGYDHNTQAEEDIMTELQNRILHKAKLYR